MKKRFKKLKQLIQTSVLDNDCFGLNINWAQGPYDPFTRNQALTDQIFAFERNPAKVTKFMEWLQEQVENEVLETIPGQQLGQAVEAAWTNTYIQTAYQKGMLRGRQELKGNSITGYQDIPPYGSQYGSLQKAFNSPFHADKVGLIYTRAYEGLKGITNEMSKQISGVLAQGISEGWNPKKIAENLTDRVDKIGITRATILARTEVIRAHHVAMVQEYKNWGVQGVIVQAEWTTAGDNRVCPVCSSLQGKVYTLEQIEPLIPRHPQCRCLALPVDVTDEVPVKEEKFKLPGFSEILAEELLSSMSGRGRVIGENGVEQFYSLCGDGSGGDRINKVADTLKNRISNWADADKQDYDAFTNWFISTGGLDNTSVSFFGVESSVIKEWARTSADKSSLSIFMQLMAEEEFALGSAVTHLNSDIVESLLSENVLSNVPTISVKNGAKKFLREMYNLSQEEFKKAGMKEVLLFRGSGHFVSDGLLDPAILEDVNKWTIQKAKINLQPMSSFSVDLDAARSFASTDGFPFRKESTFVQVSMVKVPVDRLISFPGTGYGSFSENEYVVLGGTNMESIVFQSMNKSSFSTDTMSDLFIKSFSPGD